jgi:chaperonin cofactor prefoldin
MYELEVENKALKEKVEILELRVKELEEKNDILYW